MSIVILTRASLAALIQGKDEKIDALQAELSRYEARCDAYEARITDLLDRLCKKEQVPSPHLDDDKVEILSEAEKRKLLQDEIDRRELEQMAQLALRDPNYRQIVVEQAQGGDEPSVEVLKRMSELADLMPATEMPS